MSRPAEDINEVLATHQALLTDWDFAGLAADLHRWTEQMIVEFKLQSGVPALGIRLLRDTRLGQYLNGRNERRFRTISTLFSKGVQ